MIAAWSTQDPLDQGFERRWRERVESSPYANFALALDPMRWEAGRGRHSLAVLAEEGDRSGALVLRNEPGGWTCGWPWRWQAVMTGKEAHRALGFDDAEAGWLFDRGLRAVPDGRRVRCFLPHPPAGGVPGFIAGATILQSVQHTDDEILRSMGNSKRRMVRKARESGYQVFEARDPASFEAFHRVQLDARARRATARRPPEAPAEGEHWREWELPWMWLLVARKHGVIHSGVGDSVIPGGYVEGRTAASSLEARREGASALLGFEEARRARDRGHRWLNHGGDTSWKREVSGRLGERFPLWCWLSGGRWTIPNTAETTWMSFRPLAARWLKRWRGGRNS